MSVESTVGAPVVERIVVAVLAGSSDTGTKPLLLSDATPLAAPFCDRGTYVPLSALTALVVNAVVAIWVVLVLAVAVGAVGIPVNVGLASGAAPVTWAAV